MRVVKSYGKEAEEKEKFNGLADEFCRVQKKNEVFWALFMPIIDFILGGGFFWSFILAAAMCFAVR